MPEDIVLCASVAVHLVLSREHVFLLLKSQNHGRSEAYRDCPPP
ncbi:hypothetical protein AVEN_145577-1, partial [Araneus ventricosus]